MNIEVRMKDRSTAIITVASATRIVVFEFICLTDCLTVSRIVSIVEMLVRRRSHSGSYHCKGRIVDGGEEIDAAHLAAELDERRDRRRTPRRSSLVN